MDDVAAEAGITKLIVYRHFDSKESLYGAVLARVSDRLVEEFVGQVAADPAGASVGARTLLAVAREDPDGFVLLWRHAAREPQFADYAHRFRAQAVLLAKTQLGRAGVPGDRRRRSWQAEVLMAFLVDAVVHWLEEGTPKRDHEFVELTTQALVAMVAAWLEPAP